jgi:transposase
MPRPSIGLEPYKAEIVSLCQNNMTCADIEKFLDTQYGIEVKLRTIYARLKAWGIEKHHHTLGLIFHVT